MSIPIFRDYDPTTEGGELSRRALEHKAYEQRAGRTVSLRDSIRHVLREAEAELRADFEDQAGDWIDVDAARANPALWEAYHNILNFVLGQPRFGDGRTDIRAAADAVNRSFAPAVILGAVQYAIVVRQRQIASNMTPGFTTTNMGAALGRTLSELPALREIYSARANRAAMSAEALRELYPSIRWRG
jgi:hypothetical protein